MYKHVSIRLAWHNEGWSGRICQNPKSNTYCIGRDSYPGDLISVKRDLAWESRADVAGRQCSKLDDIPACGFSINAFGYEKMRAYTDPPEWFRDDSKRAFINLQPASACIWPYEVMYSDDVKNPPGSAQKYNYNLRLERAKEYFSNIEVDHSLLFYYVNYSNPFSEDESKKYVLVGISRLKSKGDIMFYDDVSKQNREKYAGGFVWQLPLTSHYPEQGFSIPYHKYRDNLEVLSKILVLPENPRCFKYAKSAPYLMMKL